MRDHSCTVSVISVRVITETMQKEPNGIFGEFRRFANLTIFHCKSSQIGSFWPQKSPIRRFGEMAIFGALWRISPFRQKSPKWRLLCQKSPNWRLWCNAQHAKWRYGEMAVFSQSQMITLTKLLQYSYAALHPLLLLKCRKI